MINFHNYGVSAIPLKLGLKGLLVSNPNHRIVLLVPNSPAQFKDCRTLVNRASADDLTASVSSTSITLSLLLLLLLKSKILLNKTTIRFIAKDMLKKRFMAN